MLRWKQRLGECEQALPNSLFALHLVSVLLLMQNRCRVLQHTARAPFALALLRVFRLLALFFVGVVGAHFFGGRCCASIFHALLRSQPFVDGLLRDQATACHQQGNKNHEH